MKKLTYVILFFFFLSLLARCILIYELFYEIEGFTKLQLEQHNMLWSISNILNVIAGLSAIISFTTYYYGIKREKNRENPILLSVFLFYVTFEITVCIIMFLLGNVQYNFG